MGLTGKSCLCADRSAAQLSLISVAFALGGCIAIPLPANVQRTPYDQLSAEIPGISAIALKEKFGPPTLSCQGGRLWAYSWSVGHGGVVWAVIPLGGAMERLYYKFHVALLTFDATGQLIKLNKIDTRFWRWISSDEPSEEALCSDMGTCLYPRWTRIARGNEQDSRICSDKDLRNPRCGSWTLTSLTRIEVDGKPISCE